MKSCVSIDPSINNCGLAVFLEGKLNTYILVHPSAKLSDNGDYRYKARDITNKVRAVYLKIKQDYPELRLVTEIPDHFGVSGYVAREKGDVQKLAFVCGMIFGIDYDVVGYKPAEWKGQMSKAVMRERLILDFPEHSIATMDHNVVDAIGIGQKYINDITYK